MSALSTTTPSGRPGPKLARGLAAGRRLVPSRARSLVPLLLSVLVSVALALPLDNWAGTARPRPWPGGVITYWDATGWRDTVPQAVAQWNRAGARVRFVRAQSRAAADVVLLSDSDKVDRQCRQAHVSGSGRSCAGYATAIGYPGPAGAKVLVRDRPPSTLGDPPAQEVRLVVHELGHILGLTHRPSCRSVMNHSSALTGCDREKLFAAAPSSSARLCGPFPADVAAARRLYGSTRRKGSRWCYQNDAESRAASSSSMGFV
jgi:hypothetical protein